ncbi:ATP-binding cassette domain-containing protein [Candidatus Pacearchaeota archaeon]|nr:ATP-binding cassette domain-containing protein [Candidatus Pacearchaeota archaeon]MBD3282946.1 ATP-binding cassette domain-containing protein [Candidatus Pacearchaeota archaeon]
MLKITNLKKYFGGVKAVDGCGFEIPENKITALIGPNGSGKTTIFNLISGILKADSGRILLDREEITNMPVYKISNLGISRLFQQSRLFDNLTVRENLLLALNNKDMEFWNNLISYKFQKEDRKTVKDISEIIGVHFQNKLARDLSFGQKRLSEIARAVINPHKILMLDEPVAGVNPKLRKDIADLLLKLKKQGETILLIEHDMQFTLKIADKVIVMDEGKVIAEGTTKQIKNNKKVLEAYLGE